MASGASGTGHGSVRGPTATKYAAEENRQEVEIATTRSLLMEVKTVKESQLNTESVMKNLAPVKYPFYSFLPIFPYTHGLLKYLF